MRGTDSQTDTGDCNSPHAYVVRVNKTIIQGCMYLATGQAKLNAAVEWTNMVRLSHPEFQQKC